MNKKEFNQLLYARGLINIIKRILSNHSIINDLDIQNFIYQILMEYITEVN